MTLPGQQRWGQLVERAKDAGLTAVFADTSQNVEFHSTMSHSFPGFCRSTALWTAVLGDVPDTARPVTPYEQLGALGWPVLLRADHELSAMLPYNLRFQLLQGVEREPHTLDWSVMRRVAGNAMHVNQISAVLCFALLGLEQHPSDEEAL